MTKIKNMPHSIGAFLKGVGVESVELDANNHLIVHLDNGQTVDAGEFKVDDELNPNSSRPLANKAITPLFIQVNERISKLVGENATEAIDNLNEIIAFLQGFKDSETLASTLVEINKAIAEVESDLRIKWRDKGYTFEGMRFSDFGEYEVSGITYKGNDASAQKLVVCYGKSFDLASGERVQLTSHINATLKKNDGKYTLLLEPASTSGVPMQHAVYWVDRYFPVPELLIPESIAKVSDLQGKVDKVEGKGLSSNDYTDEDKEQVAKIEGKQDTLTLTVKDNGNIVLGNIAGQTKEFMPATPSGDPMHYYYLSHFGVTYNESTGFFELEYLKDLTANDMRNAVRVSGDVSWLYNDASSVSGLVATEDNPRTNIAMKSGIIKVLDKYGIIRWERALEQWIIGKCSAYSFATITDVWDGNDGLRFALVGVPELRYIVGVIDISTLRNGILSILLGDSATKLQEVRLAKMKTSQMIIHQKNLSKDSISYLLSNRTNTEEISLTLPAELYNKIMTDGGEWTDLRSLCEATTDKGRVILELNA